MRGVTKVFCGMILATGIWNMRSAVAADPSPPVGSKFGERAPDFPPGQFSDGGHYSLADFQGKVLVLFFYENSCPRCRGLIPERNAVVAAFKDKPVKFLAIGPHDTLADVRDYFTTTRLAMPIFADPFGVMQKRYGFAISLQNIYQFRVLGPDGVVRGYDMTNEDITKAIQDIQWKYKDKGYDARLNPAIEAFEWNQWLAGMKLLRPHLAALDKAEKESAQKLFNEIKALGEQWKADAETATGSDPVKAFDLYQRVASVFEGDDLAKSVAQPLAELRKKKEITAELDARKDYAQLEIALGRATADQKNQVLAFCRTFVKNHADTPTAVKVQAYLDDLTK